MIRALLLVIGVTLAALIGVCEALLSVRSEALTLAYWRLRCR
jgi:hypothetical protein